MKDGFFTSLKKLRQEIKPLNIR